MREYDLGDAQLRAIFERHIARLMTAGGSRTESAVIMVAAQPGAGKTRAIYDARAGHPGAFPVVGDDFRPFHPAYTQLMRDDPLHMPDATAQAAGRWVEMSLDRLKEQRSSLIIETTMRHPDATERTLNGFKRAGYRAEAIIVATPPELSLMGTLTRYVDQASRQGEGRWVDPKAHDEAMAQMPRTLAGQMAKGNIDHVTVTNRAGDTLYDSDITARNRSEAIAAARNAISQGQRFDSLTPDQRQQWDHDVQRVRAFISDRPEKIAVRNLADRIIASGQRAAHPGRQMT